MGAEGEDSQALSALSNKMFFGLLSTYSRILIYYSGLSDCSTGYTFCGEACFITVAVVVLYFFLAAEILIYSLRA